MTKPRPARPLPVPAAGATAGPPADEPDLAPAHERALGEWARAEHGSEFVFVTGYPMAKRPFYTHPEPGRPRHSNSLDLLFRGLELVTAGQRLVSILGDCLQHLGQAGYVKGLVQR